MARTQSILLFGEGKTDAVFLSHLRDLYRVPGTAIKVEHGRGGSEQTVVHGAIKIACLADYSNVLILLDSDRNDEPIPPEWCREHRLSIKRSAPCLEALLLEILGDGKLSGLRHGANASDRCKSHFQGTYLGTDRSSHVLGRLKKTLQARFSLELLEEARTRIPILNEIIHAIGGGIS
ncbi:MAG: hypothetical protein NTV46_02855 [Verrucomicrobia bacterium]|nr:hypothetical protein [Verrucomicrobiota bacterium]